MSKLGAPTFLKRFGLDKSEQHLSKESTYNSLEKSEKIFKAKDGLEAKWSDDEMTLKPSSGL